MNKASDGASLSSDLCGVRFILVRPRNPGNLGCIARTLKNFGFTRLDLVQPRLVHEEEAVEWACGAHDLIKRARRFDSLRNAVSDCRAVIGTSGRKREPGPLNLTPQALGPFAAAAPQPVALVFGPEQSGLKIDELALCQRSVQIPTHPDFPTINLAQSAALIAWELHRFAISDDAGAAISENIGSSKHPTAGAMQAFFNQAERALLELDCIRPENSSRRMNAFRRIFDRADITTQELRFLRGIFRQIENQEAIIRARIEKNDNRNSKS
ncbi:RNA methyltransferase [Candidatus Sumerlaeota bacterium]|nr:RNA methyltransferase [Candidatus Sumerlaeota bacterium]